MMLSLAGIESGITSNVSLAIFHFQPLLKAQSWVRALRHTVPRQTKVNPSYIFPFGLGGILGPTKYQRVSEKWLIAMLYFSRTFSLVSFHSEQFSSTNQAQCM